MRILIRQKYLHKLYFLTSDCTNNMYFSGWCSQFTYIFKSKQTCDASMKMKSRNYNLQALHYVYTMSVMISPILIIMSLPTLFIKTP